jgi:CRISPR-associated RAMP protein (TIGR02581 family)
MLKKIINHAIVEFRIIPLEPLLIKSGQATTGGVDMSFVRTYRTAGKDYPYIPGSSLKGVIRSYAEKICRSLRYNPVPVCLPYVKPGEEQPGENNQASCGLRLNKYKDDPLAGAEVYRLSCPACRLFGSHWFIGRLATSDAYLDGTDYLLEIRDGVAIDRLTGGTAGGAKYDLEVLTRGEFRTSLEIRNFERWQLGLAALVLRDMEQGLVRLGFGKSRGLGRIRIEIESFKISYFNQAPDRLAGLASFTKEDEHRMYGFFPESDIQAPPLPEPEADGLRNDYNLTSNWKDVINPGVADLLAYISQVAWPRDLETFVRGGQ